MRVRPATSLSSRRAIIRNFGIALSGFLAFGRSASAQQAAAPRPRPVADPDRSGAFNVKDYGAICDGAADDYAAFNRALTAVAALSVGAGTLIVPGPMKIGRN